MKTLLLVLLGFSPFAFASKPFTGINDIAISKGTGVDHIQFVLGGDGQQITGAAKQSTVVRMFRTNIISLYHCYSETYGGESKAIGKLVVHLQFQGSTQGPMAFEAEGINSPHFLSCLKESWAKLSLDNAPANGGILSITMPIQAAIRDR